MSREEVLQCAGSKPDSNQSWRIAGVSVTGTSHTRLGLPCQDSNRFAVLQSGVLVASIADGAGSAAYAKEASQLATETVISEAYRSQASVASFENEACGKALLKEWLMAARKAIEAEAGKLDVTPRELATTLIIVVAAPGIVAAAQIGDGATVIRGASGNIMALTTPKLGEYINESTFLTSPDIDESIQLEVWHGEMGQFAAFSDGLQMLALQFPGSFAHKPFFDPLFNFIAQASSSDDTEEALHGFLNSQRIRERSDDDLTLLLAHRV